LILGLTAAAPKRILVRRVKTRGRVYVQIVIGAVLGAGYGLWGLEAASPLAIPLVLWALMVLLLVWRMAPQLRLFVACAIAYTAGFGAVWTIVLGQLLATCKPPSCQTADATTDVFYAAAVLLPLLVAASVVITVRQLVFHR
jgi:hypothetical protein